MKAAVVVRSNDSFTFQITNTSIPPLSPTDILIKLSVTGVCGTDLALASGAVGPTCSILGHEGIGYIVALGTSVTLPQAKIGDRVAIAWLRDICGKCAFCLQPGGEARCAAQLNSGRKIDGTFAEYAVVPSRYIIRVPDSVTVSDDVLAPIVCGGVTAYKALKICGAGAGQWVAISGAGGGVGSLAVQYAKAMGYRVLAIDAGSEKGRFAVESGAEEYVDVLAATNLPDEVMRITQNRGAKAALVCAGVKAAYESAPRLLGPSGTMVCVGILPPGQQVPFEPLLMIDNDLRIISSSVGTREDMYEAFDFVSRGLVRPATVEKRLEDLPEIAGTLGQMIGKPVIRFKSLNERL
ncbi:alcohol dehydrogenase, propanol-preferring [Alternaria panax]|uniref:alcohol dehydrogenase n=1 Tax=Alternaria panax TaxID=48097 RepID=A0AAD4I7I6_9PLEO|nr:alcohol dehydrogenase, propanol-preferring [Alternaria panax]